MQPRRIAIVSFDKDHGLVHQRLHLPFMELPREAFEIISYNVEDFGPSDAFYVDCVVMSHVCDARFLELAQRCRYQYRIPCVVDIDDLLTDIPCDHPDFEGLSMNFVPQLLQEVSHAVFSTRGIADRLGHLVRGYTVVENTISKRFWDGYTPPRKPHKNTFVVGWTGSQSHRQDQLTTFYRGLDRFLEDNVESRAYFHLMCPDSLRRKYGSQVHFEPRGVHYLDYQAFASTYPFSVCLVGLAPCAFNDAKSDLKLLEMAPHGIPLMASPRPEFLRHRDRDIMLYACDEDTAYPTWQEALEWAKANPAEMLAKAERAKEYVMRERLSSRAAVDWAHVLATLVDLQRPEKISS